MRLPYNSIYGYWPNERRALRLKLARAMRRKKAAPEA
jgi:hypothetical protein